MRILAFDPRIGYAVVDHTSDTDTFHVITFGTYNSDKFEPDFRKDVKYYSPALIYLKVTKDNLKHLMSTYDPDIVVAENAFNKKFIQAFRVLACWLSTVALYLYENHKKILFLLQPLTIKKHVTQIGKGGKLPMKEAILNMTNLTWEEGLDKETLTEHSIDAIGIAIAYIKETKTT